MLTPKDISGTYAKPYAVYGGKVHSFIMINDPSGFTFDGEFLKKNYEGKIFAVFKSEADALKFADNFKDCQLVSYGKYCNAYCLSPVEKVEPTQDREKVQDAMQTALAMTHHLQTRILQCTIRGKVSPNIAEEIQKICDQIAENFKNNC